LISKFSQDVEQNTVWILQDVNVRISNDVITLVRQPSIAHDIPATFDVLSTIGFDHELAAKTNKIDDVRTDWHLAPKLRSVQSPVAQQQPEFSLGIGRLPAHRSCT